MDLKLTHLIPAVPLVRSGLSGCLDDIMLSMGGGGDETPPTLAEALKLPSPTATASRSSSSTSLSDEAAHSI